MLKGWQTMKVRTPKYAKKKAGPIANMKMNTEKRTARVGGERDEELRSGGVWQQREGR